MDRCHNWKGHHIPGCMGCAVFGHERCTCGPPDREDSLEMRIKRLERAVLRLEAQLTEERSE